ncbi:MAG: hypothetical protein JW955_17945 [Sedimentisphaerales bacterium]|nr:hypothetical protein [Sedimentisphaerales bacterium]
MSNILQYAYDASSTNLYRTDAYSGADPDVGTTMRFSADLDLTESLFAICEIKFDAANVVGDLIVTLYRRLDGSWDGDELEILRTTIDSDGSEDLWSIALGPDFGPGHYRFGLLCSSENDSFDVDLNARFARFQIVAA